MDHAILQYLEMMANPDDAEMAVELDRIMIEEDITAEDFKMWPPRLYEANLVWWDIPEECGFSRTRLYIGTADKGKRITFAWDAVEGRWEKVFDSRERNI